MTCLVACRDHDGTLVLGGDTRDSYGDGTFVDGVPKVWRSGSVLIGAGGDGDLCQLLQHGLTITLPKDRSQIMSHLVLNVNREIRTLASSAGLKDDAELVLILASDCGFLSVCHQSYWQEVIGDHVAVGSGAAWAEGSLRESSKLGAKTRVNRALSAAAAHNATCGPPFIYLTTKQKRVRGKVI